MSTDEKKEAKTEVGRESANKTRKLDAYFAIFSFLLVLIVAGLFAPLGIDFHHDGFLYCPAEDLLNGKTPFRDTYILHGFLTTWLHSWCMYLLGPSEVVLRFSAVLFYALGAAGLYYVWRKFLPVSLTLVSVFLYLGLMPIWIGTPLFAWSSVYLIPIYAMLLLFGYSLLENLEKRNYAALMAAAMALSSLILWQFREPPGIFNFLCLMLFWPAAALAGFMRWKDALRFLGIYAGICLAGIILWFVYLAANGALTDWYVMTKSEAVKIHVRSFGGTPGFLGTLTHIYNCLIINQNIPFATMEPFWMLIPLAAGGYLLRTFLPTREYSGSTSAEDAAESIKSFRQKNVKPHLLLMALVCCGSCMQYYPVCCFIHCYWGAAIVLGLLVYAVWSATGKSCSRLSTLVCFIILAFIFFKPVFIWRLPTGLRRLSVAYAQEPLRFPRPFVGVLPVEEKDIMFFPVYRAAYLYGEKFPDSEATAIVQSPMQWYLLPHASRFYKYFIFRRGNSEQQEALSDFIREKRPLLLLDHVYRADFKESLTDYEIIYTSKKVEMTSAPLLLMAPKERAAEILCDPEWDNGKEKGETKK